jgi:hypothetical protein
VEEFDSCEPGWDSGKELGALGGGLTAGSARGGARAGLAVDGCRVHNNRETISLVLIHPTAFHESAFRTGLEHRTAVAEAYSTSSSVMLGCTDVGV